MTNSNGTGFDKKSDLRNAYLILDSQIITITTNDFNLGRHFENDIIIRNESVSRKHSQIRFEFDQYVLYDLNSTSGTFVNNKQINRCVLNSGDLISLADVRIMFIDQDEKLQDMTKMATRNLVDDLIF